MYFSRLVNVILGLVALRPLEGAAPDADSPPAAYLLVKKEFLNKHFVQNLDLIVKYTIYNVGNGPAFDVRLRDFSFPEEFQVVSGHLDVRMFRIPPQANVSHAVVFKPTTTGSFNVSYATVTYLKTANLDSAQVGLSSAPSAITITDFPEHERKNKSHACEWFPAMLGFGVFILNELAACLTKHYV